MKEWTLKGLARVKEAIENRVSIMRAHLRLDNVDRQLKDLRDDIAKVSREFEEFQRRMWEKHR